MVLCKKMHKKSDHQLLRFPIHDKLNEDIFQRKRSKAHASF